MATMTSMKNGIRITLRNIVMADVKYVVYVALSIQPTLRFMSEMALLLKLINIRGVNKKIDTAISKMYKKPVFKVDQIEYLFIPSQLMSVSG